MSITALDIQQEGFEHSIRGYDVVQVDDFLERVAQEVDNLNNTISELEAELEQAREDAAKNAGNEKDDEKLKRASARQLERAKKAENRAIEAEARAQRAEEKAQELEEKLAPLKQKLTEKSEMDAVISNAIISAQRSADTLKESARAEGERLYRESEAKARELIRIALEEKQRILAEIKVLETSADKFRENYKRLLARFSTQADDSFNTLGSPKIPDSVLDDMLPKYEDIDLDELQKQREDDKQDYSGNFGRNRRSSDSDFSFDTDTRSKSDLSSFSKESFGSSGSFGAKSKFSSSDDFNINDAKDTHASSSAKKDLGGRKKTGNTGVIAASMSELLDDSALIDGSDK